MQKNKIFILVAILVVVIVGETVFLFKQKTKEEILKSQVIAAQNFSKGLKNIFVQVRIKEETGSGEFTDSIYYSADEWSKLTETEVKKAIQGRVDNWVKAIAAPTGM